MDNNEEETLHQDGLVVYAVGLEKIQMQPILENGKAKQLTGTVGSGLLRQIVVKGY